MDLALLCSCAFLAGFVDAVVGGGGLIQLPALFVFLPPPLAASVPLVFGTNKFASLCGTSTALAQYATRVRIPWSTVAPAAVAAALLSACGAKCVQVIASSVLKPIVLLLLVAVAAYTWRKKDFGSIHAPRFVRHRERIAGVAAGAIIGFYDGFFGPGTGSFLIFLFIGVFRFDFLTASGSAKAINFATNVAAVLIFGLAGQILWRYAIPMAACNVAGALIGARLAVIKGNRFVRVFFLLIVTAMIARFGWELLRQRA